jgi:DNA-binding protein HU-beta
MIKAELISAIYEKGNYSTKREAEKALQAVIGAITDALARGEKVSVSGFGTFDVRDRAPKTSINPATGKPINIPAKKVPGFKAGKALKEVVDKK